MNGRVSVALCSYNGGRFLHEQLSSLDGQTRLPDEIVISDDGSEDNTVAIIHDFIARTSVPVVFRRNKVRLGHCQNFAATIACCTGDLIALCDQDDVWYPEKLARMELLFAIDPELLMLFSNAS